MKALLIQQGFLNSLKGKEALQAKLSYEDKEDLLDQTWSTILLLLLDEVLWEFVVEASAAVLLLKLENLYMTKSLISPLYLK